MTQFKKRGGRAIFFLKKGKFANFLSFTTVYNDATTLETKENSIRIISGYGPQENWEEEKRLPFFLALEIEI